MKSIGEESLEMHYRWKGKIEVKARTGAKSREALSLAYTPGVATPCLEIQKDVNKSYELTRRWNTVAVVTDGSAVLGLGDIGPEAGMPVMEGKALLFKEFGGVDAIPLCIRSKDADTIIQTVKLLAGSFGGINLEDISAPRCFEIERRLIEECDIPVFHDDQHGTAIVTAAALINASRVVNKEIKDLKVVVNGAGAAGRAIGLMLFNLGVKDIIFCDRVGILTPCMEGIDPYKKELAELGNKECRTGSLADAVKDTDVFIGVSAPNVLTEEMVKTMNKDAIVFAMANPNPEIMPDLAKHAGAAVVGTGRSDFPNQINNVLAFPGVFRGALDAKAKRITEDMKLAAAYAIADLVSEDQLSADRIMPDAFDERVCPAVALGVFKSAVKDPDNIRT